MDFPQFDHSASTSQARGPSRDWLVFGLSAACLILAGVSVCLTIAVVRRSTPVVVTKEITKEVVKPRDPESTEALTATIEPTEHCLVTRLEMMSPPVALTFAGILNGERTFEVKDWPFMIGLKEDAEGHISLIRMQVIQAELSDTTLTRQDIVRHMDRLRAILTTMEFVLGHSSLSQINKIVEMCEVEVKGESSVKLAILSDFDVHVRLYTKTVVPVVQILLTRRVKE